MDGQTEQVNQVEQFLQLFVNQQQDDWYEWLSMLISQQLDPCFDMHLPFHA